MDYVIANYLTNKDTSRYGVCKLCGTQVYWTRQKVQSHKRSGNCVEQISEVNSGNMQPSIQPANLPVTRCQQNDRDEEQNHNGMESNKAVEYILYLQQFLHLGLYEKKRYLRVRAPDSFIRLLRECMRNVKRGVIPCDKALFDACNCSYSFGRIDKNSANHSEARNLFCTNKTMVILNKLLPTVINHLQSFTRNL